VQIYAGTSGYSYAPWKGSFYPEKLPAAKMLSFYATRLPAVEINNTFYRMPRKELLAKWGEEVPASFRFALKAPQRITHHGKLSPESADSVRFLHDASQSLGERLGPVLFQLPPTFRKDLPRLQAFLVILHEHAPGLRAAFEFRHASWFEDDVVQALRGAEAALCIAEDEKLATPLQATAPWGYLRLRRQDYVEADIARWAAQIQAQPWQETYVFFKHEDEGLGPRLAGQLQQLIAEPGRAHNSVGSQT
jgi:uncharacterized protein YecE (DUF72 family)